MFKWSRSGLPDAWEVLPVKYSRFGKGVNLAGSAWLRGCRRRRGDPTINQAAEAVPSHVAVGSRCSRAHRGDAPWFVRLDHLAMVTAPQSLVQRLFDGPLDIVGDVHGEITALRRLLDELGYTADGTHPQGRRLVFLGDFADRGPDSPAVIEAARAMIETRRAQAVLGNHELNLLLGSHKPGNGWFYGKSECLDVSLGITRQRMLDPTLRSQVLRFFRSLPLVLHRDDLRVVHACWDPRMVNLAGHAGDVLTLYTEHRKQIEADIAKRPAMDSIDRALEHHNRNPVRVLTSGPERRADNPGATTDRVPLRQRVPWWRTYHESCWCVFGHYANTSGTPLRSGHALCLDFGVGKRWRERAAGIPESRYRSRLAALRMPERLLVLDDGSRTDC